MEKQRTSSELPHNKLRMQKDVDEFPQFSEDIAAGHAAWNDWPWKLHRINGTTFELYNLDDDPMEKLDLAGEPNHADRLDQMKTELNIWMRSVVRSLNGHDYSSADNAQVFLECRLGTDRQTQE